MTSMVLIIIADDSFCFWVNFRFAVWSHMLDTGEVGQ